MASTGCFGTLYAWAQATGLSIAEVDGFLLTYYQTHGGSFYGFPAGQGPLTSPIQAMAHRARQRGEPFLIKGVTSEQAEVLEREFPGRFSYENDRDSADYIYRLDSMATLAGRPMQKKRNLCNRFEKNHPDWRFEVLEQRHHLACAALLRRWLGEQPGPDETGRLEEQEAIFRSLSNFERLPLEGGVLMVGDQLVAFTIGEPVGDQAFDIHFEKADNAYDGAFPMINREFSRHLRQMYPDLRWVNREDDLGLENLRKSKESYHPAFLLEKYTVSCLDS